MLCTTPQVSLPFCPARGCSSTLTCPPALHLKPSGKVGKYNHPRSDGPVKVLTINYIFNHDYAYLDMNTLSLSVPNLFLIS